MEGQGPGRSGTPRSLGFIAASDDTYALDLTVCNMVGADPLRVLTNRVAAEMGYVNDRIDVAGEMPVVENFRFPEISPVVFGPRRLHGFMRRNLVQRPVQDVSQCRLCGECWKYCPAKAISRKGGKLLIDYDKCIRCYCCIEVCPHAALHTEEPLLGKVFGRLRR
jgi:ferredoxin